jgi:hypothetical protein
MTTKPQCFRETPEQIEMFKLKNNKKFQKFHEPFRRTSRLGTNLSARHRQFMLRSLALLTYSV